jgi:tRNA/rRNA methyltransferase
MAPVNPAFASLNLGQAVLLIGYEWFKRGEHTLGDGTRQDGAHDGPGLKMPGTRPATKEELIGFFEHLEAELDMSGFLNPLEKRPAMVRNIRNMFQRTGLTEQDVRTLRGIVSSLTRKHLRNKKNR